MSLLEPTLVNQAPELAVLDILGETLITAIVAIVARHPDIEGDHPLGACCEYPSACCFANTIIEDIYVLDKALAYYRHFIEQQLGVAHIADTAL